MMDLHRQAVSVNKSRMQAEWELAVLLLAMDERRAWSELGCASAGEYGDKYLSLAPEHSFGLLKTARDVRSFPLLCRAWRRGELSRSKLREICRVVNPETEADWLEFGRTHTCREVERRVALSPRAAGLAAHAVVWRTATPEQPTLPAAVPLAAAQSTLFESAPEQPADGAFTVGPLADTKSPFGKPSQQPATVPGPRLIAVRLVFEAEEYALLEAALDLVAAKCGHRRRESLVTEMARRVLSQSGARSRRRHAVVVERDAETGSAAYITDRGYLPVKETAQPTPKRSPIPPVETEKVAASIPVGSMVVADRPRPSTKRRLPAAVDRAVLERAGYRCERCGRSRQLHVHHRVTRCDGGTNDVENLMVVCSDCHRAAHEEDFTIDPRFVEGRQAGLARAWRKNSTADSLGVPSSVMKNWVCPSNADGAGNRFVKAKSGHP